MGKPAKPVEVRQQALNLFRAGRPVLEIARLTGCGATTIARWVDLEGLERSGVQQRGGHGKANRSFTDEQEREILAQYGVGSSLNQIAAHWGCCTVTVRNILKRRGVDRRGRGAVVRTLPGETVQEILSLYKGGLSQEKIARRLGTSQSSISRVLRAQGEDAGVKSGSNHHSWKSGRYVLNGYARVLASPDSRFSSMRDTQGYIPEHRLVMAQHLGRPLLKTEQVHHKNGDRLDNRLDNLELRHGPHGKGVKLRCRCCGSHDIEAVEIGTPPRG